LAGQAGHDKACRERRSGARQAQGIVPRWLSVRLFWRNWDYRAEHLELHRRPCGLGRGALCLHCANGTPGVDLAKRKTSPVIRRKPMASYEDVIRSAVLAVSPEKVGLGGGS